MLGALEIKVLKKMSMKYLVSNQTSELIWAINLKETHLKASCD